MSHRDLTLLGAKQSVVLLYVPVTLLKVCWQRNNHVCATAFKEIPSVLSRGLASQQLQQQLL